MPLFSKFAAVTLALLPFVSAEWEQCGGLGWSGPACSTGFVCTYVNDWYSQCLKSTGTNTQASSAAPVPTGSATGLNNIAKSKGKVYFGSATDNPELSDAPYVALLSNKAEFGQLTPGNSMKWDATEGTRDVFTFTNADTIVNLAKKNGQLLRGHTCVWHSQLPSWVSNGNFNAATLTSIITKHCSTVIGRYKGAIYSWDVINEPFNDDGTFRDSVFYKTLNTGYFGVALKAARAADPAAKLYINDYNIDGLGAKSTAMANLVKKLKAEGSPIDGVGIQGHMISGSLPSYSSLKSNLEQFTALGVDVAYTELDIRITLPVTSQKLEQQRKDYETVVKACNDVPRCVGITIWDYTDKYSWVPGVFDGQGAALPWDENFNKKPAYSGIVTGFA